MQRRNSKSKINGKIIMMQNDLMSKLATIQHPVQQSTDQLGFPTRNGHLDSLTNLLSKAKEVTKNNKDKIQVAKRSSSKNCQQKQNPQKKKSDTGTFLTGIGLVSEPQQKKQQQIENEQTKFIHMDFYANPTNYEWEDPEKTIKSMIKKNQQDDLAELRRMIKETDTSLQDYGKKLLKTRKQVLGMAEKLPNVNYHMVEKIYRYEDKGY